MKPSEKIMELWRQTYRKPGERTEMIPADFDHVMSLEKFLWAIVHYLDSLEENKEHTLEGGDSR